MQNNLHNLATLLYIDTAGEKAMVGMSKDAQLIAYAENITANTHASFVQVAIEKMVDESGIALQALDAIVVTLGPGSYTGLRVGLASAKGIAYTLNKPLIGLSTLALLANHASKNKIVMEAENGMQIFSMIDAKRMEVFGAVYDLHQNNILPEQAIILDTDYIKKLLQNGPLLCVGNGATKTKTLLSNAHLYFMESSYSIENLVELAMVKWNEKQFENIAYSSPSYLKDFYQPPAK